MPRATGRLSGGSKTSMRPTPLVERLSTSRAPVVERLSMRRAPIAAALLATACATGSAPQLARAPDWTAGEIRQPALFIRIGDTYQLSDRERASLADRYEGALVEAFDERGVPPTDVQRLGASGAFEPRRALARAREVHADYAVVVELRVEQRETVFCRGGRRAFAAATTVWSQGVQVLRASDGSSRIVLPPGQGLDVTEIEADCANPRRSRLRDQAEMIASAVEAIAERILGR